MRIFVVPIYTSVVLSHNRTTVCNKLYLFLVAFNVPVYSLFCCQQSCFSNTRATPILVHLNGARQNGGGFKVAN